MNSAIMRDIADYITTSDVKKIKMFLEIPYGIREKIKDGLDLMEYLQYKDFVYQNYEYNTNEAKIKLILNLLNEIGRKDIYKKFIVKFENPPSYEESVNPPPNAQWKYTGGILENRNFCAENAKCNTPYYPPEVICLKQKELLDYYNKK
nr:uncharacterized protein LOC124807461 [Hydra vulgaris]